MKKAFLVGAAFASLLAAPVMAADLPVKAPPVIAPAPYNWTGFYIGGNVGYGWGNADTSFDPQPVPPFTALAPITLSPNPKGIVGGVQLGFNKQMGILVLGVETDFQASDINGNVTQSPIMGVGFVSPGYLQASQKTDWFGTLRARVGITAVDRLLLYVTGGLAYGHVSYSAQTYFNTIASYPVPTFSKTDTGWTIGGGVEWALNQNWLLKLEYLYYDLGTQSASAERFPVVTPPFHVVYDWKTIAQIARVGINYKF